MSPRAVHAKHIRRLDGNGDVCRGYGMVEMLRRKEVAVFARVGGCMVGMRLLREVGVDIS